MKKILTLVTILFLAVALVGCSPKTDKEKIADSYTTLESADHVYVSLAVEDIEEVASTEENMIIYFGAPKCSACVAIVPLIDQMAKQYGIDTIYYVYFEYDGALAQEYYENGTYDYNFGGTPLFVYYVDGEYQYSNFTYLNPDSNRYDKDSNYVDQIISMFESY